MNNDNIFDNIRFQLNSINPSDPMLISLIYRICETTLALFLENKGYDVLSNGFISDENGKRQSIISFCCTKNTLFPARIHIFLNKLRTLRNIFAHTNTDESVDAALLFSGAKTLVEFVESTLSLQN